MKGTIYFLQHGIEKPEVIEYDDVRSEEHFMNMMAMALIIGDKEGAFTDKAFGYFEGTWYHSHLGQRTNPDVDVDLQSLKNRLTICPKCKNQKNPNCDICNGYGVILDYHLAIKDEYDLMVDIRNKDIEDIYELTEEARNEGIDSVRQVREMYCKINERYDSCSVCPKWDRIRKCTLLREKRKVD